MDSGCSGTFRPVIHAAHQKAWSPYQKIFQQPVSERTQPMKKRGELFSNDEISQLDSHPSPQQESRSGFMRTAGLFFGEIFNSREYKKAEREMQELNIDESCMIYYDLLRDKILYSVASEQLHPHYIAFTSCTKGEGVTTVSINFSSTLTRHNDGKILLVDANYEEPAVHQHLEVNRSPGLSEILLDGVDYASAVQTTAAPNLSVVTAGKKSTRISHMFETEEFYNFLQYAKHAFDFIVFDTPPMCECSGKYCVCSTTNVASKLGRQIDGVCLVIESEQVRYQVVKQAQEQLSYSKVNILGVVLNKRKFHVPKWIYDTL